MRRLGALGLAALVVLAVVLLLPARDDDESAYLVRAVFANAFALTEDLEVKIAGVPVGRVQDLEVTPEGHAAVVLRIDDAALRDFRADAHCTIRPQSLIGERYVACTPTERRARGAPRPPPLPVVPEGRDGEGQHLLGLERTTRPVDPDVVTNALRLPERERLRIVLDELGLGLAARGDDLRDALRRADPALAATDRALRVLRGQSRQLERLAADADAALSPVARDRTAVAELVTRASRVATVGARRRPEVEAGLRRLPGLLRELPATLDVARRLAVRATPVARDLRAAAPDVSRVVAGLAPLAREGVPALERLGAASDVGRPVLVRARPVTAELARTARTLRPVAADLGALSRSLDEAGVARRLVDFLFYTVMSTNGFDEAGHYLRAGLLVNACSTYAIQATPDCAATFQGRGRDPRPGAGAATAGDARTRHLLDLLLGDG